MNSTWHRSETKVNESEHAMTSRLIRSNTEMKPKWNQRELEVNTKSMEHEMGVLSYRTSYSTLFGLIGNITQERKLDEEVCSETESARNSASTLQTLQWRWGCNVKHGKVMFASRRPSTQPVPTTRYCVRASLFVIVSRRVLRLPSSLLPPPQKRRAVGARIG